MAPTLTRERVEDTVAKFVYPRALTFDEWLETGDRDCPTELVNGSPVEQAAVELGHATLWMWLMNVTAMYAERAGIGIVLGSRSPIRISDYGGRMPDLFFVRRNREQIITSKATVAAPDLVIEIVAASESAADIRVTETDYRTLGVSEIVFVDPRRRHVRVLRKRDANYEEETNGTRLRFRSMDGLTLASDWLFVEPRPDPIDTVLSLLVNRAAFSVAAESPRAPDAAHLLADAREELARRYGSCPPFPAELAEGAGTALLVARIDGVAAGCVAFLPFADDPETAEIKRLFVAEAARGRGVGAALMAALEREVAGMGYRRLVLETGIFQPEAIRLYGRHGYVRMPCYGEYATNPKSLCYEKRLPASPPFPTPTPSLIPMREGVRGWERRRREA